MSGTPLQNDPPRILLLGIGNILLKDEGAGVHVINQLGECFIFSSNVTLLDGGTLGIHLMEPISHCNKLIVVDVVKMGSPAGTLHRLSLGDFQNGIRRKNSLHQIELLETLTFIRMSGVLPDTVIVGIEPENYTDWSTTLTNTVSARLKYLKAVVLAEVGNAGGSFRTNENPQSPVPTDRNFNLASDSGKNKYT